MLSRSAWIRVQGFPITLKTSMNNPKHVRLMEGGFS